MKKTNFDHLLQRYMSGQLSEQEKAKLEAWLDVVKTRYRSDLVLTKNDEDKLFNKITSAADSVDEVVTFRPENVKGNMFARPWLRVAATILLLATASYSIWYFVMPKPQLVETVARVDMEKHILNDGTLVWLHKGGKITYTVNEGEPTRTLTLEGTALFEVAKDPENPFFISCGDINIKVLGTSFSVKTDSKSIELNVLTGKVNLSSKSDNKGIDVRPKEKVIYSASGKLDKMIMDETDVEAITADTDYNMAFRDVTMDYVIGRIEKKFNVTVNAADKKLFMCHITADFTDNALDTSLQMLSELIDITYTINKNVVTISGSGCK